MEMTVIFFLLALLGTVSAIACTTIAHRKRLNILLWAIAGFLLGPFAIPIALVVPNLSQQELN